MAKKKFERFLSQAAFAVAKSHETELQKMSKEGKADVEFRLDDTVMIYHQGQKALTLGGLGSQTATVETFKEKGKHPLPSPGMLWELYEESRGRIEKHLEKRSMRREIAGELSAQARLMAHMKGTDSDFVALDQQVAIPRDALTDSDFARIRVDLLAVERETGDLWLMELKLADNEELDGDVLGQLDLTQRLPGILVGGASAFAEHYRQVLSQKQALGLIDGKIQISENGLHTALVVVGNRDEAQAKVACWEAVPTHLSDVLAALLDKAMPISKSCFGPLAATFTAADASKKGLWAPRRPRFNDFTAKMDEHQKGWAERWEKKGRKAHPFGPLWESVQAYVDAHDAPKHTEYKHPRSSQAACFQLFAPLLAGVAGAEQAMLEALALQFEALCFQGEKISEVHFEYPHQKDCKEANKACHQNMKKLVGEGRMTTRLDAFLVVEGVRYRSKVRLAVGIEFKYTEPEFGRCGGFLSRGNTPEGKRACMGVSRSVSRARRHSCYLRHNQKRLYLSDEGLDSFFRQGHNPLNTEGPCLLLGPANQLYRSQFLTHKLMAHCGCDDWLFVVLAHDGNEVLFAPERTLPGLAPFAESAFDRYKNALKGCCRMRLGKVGTNAVIKAYEAHCKPADWLEALSGRYWFEE